MRINIFRNPFVDSQVSFLLDNLDEARKKQTEEYWRAKITDEIFNRVHSLRSEVGGCCFYVQYCDVVDAIEMSEKKSNE